MTADARVSAVPAHAPRLSRRAWKAIRLAPAWVALSMLTLTTIYPIFFVAFTALKTVSGFAADPLGPPQSPTLDNVQTVLSRGLLTTNALNSLIVSVSGVVVVVSVSCLAGFALAILRFPLRRAALLGIAGLMIQPTALLMIPVVMTLSAVGLTNSFLGIVLLYAGLGIPFGTYMMYSYMQSTPREVIDAARVDGASTLRILASIIVPLSAPALGALATLEFIGFWNEFLFALLILQNQNQKTVVVALSTLQAEQFLNVPVTAAGMLVSIIPPLVVFILLHRQLFSGLTAGAVR